MKLKPKQDILIFVVIIILPYENMTTTNNKISYFGISFYRKSTLTQNFYLIWIVNVYEQGTRNYHIIKSHRWNNSRLKARYIYYVQISRANFLADAHHICKETKQRSIVSNLEGFLSSDRDPFRLVGLLWYSSLLGKFLKKFYAKLNCARQNE